MKNAVLRGKPYVENPHVRFDEGAVACPPKPRRGSLLCKIMAVVVVAGALGALASPDWTFVPAGTPANGGSGTITSSDGMWTLNVRVTDASKKTLSLGQYLDTNAKGGGHAKVSGSGDLDLRGTIIRSGTSETWTLTHLTYGCIGRGETSGFTDPASFYAPTTLQTMHQCFMCTSTDYHQAFTNVVVDAPNFNKLSTDKIFILGSGVDTNLWRLVFKTPALATIPNNGFSVSWANPDNEQQLKLWGSNFGEWDLTGVTSLGDYGFFGRHIGGTLNLPKVQKIGYDAFYNTTNMTKALLSPELKQLRLIDQNAFFENQWGSNHYVDQATLREVVMGGAFGFTIKTNAFCGQTALTYVTFTGAKPIYDIQDDGVVFGRRGSSGQKAKTMAFYVPNNAEWADVIAQATPATDAERQAWSTAHPDHDPIWGVVPASVFHTANDQYLGFYAPRIKAPKFIYDTRTGDGATFESLGPYPAAADGSWPTNNSFRITAVIGAGGTFDRWYGDMPKEFIRQQTVVATGDKFMDIRWLLPRITRQWTYDTSARLLKNAYWELHAYPKSGTALYLGSQTGDWNGKGRSLTEKGGGYLDLGGPIVGTDGKSYAIVDLVSGSGGLGATATKPGPTVCITPGTLTGAFLNYQHFSGETQTLEALIVDEPAVTTGFDNNSGWLLGGRQLRYLQFIVPKLGKVGRNAFNQWDMPDVEMNFSTFDLSSVTNVDYQAFYFCRKARGALDLPKLKVFGDYAFYGCGSLPCAYLATNRHEAVETIGSQIFRDCLSLEKLELNLASGTVCPENFLYGSTAVREIRFLGLPPTRESLANLLRYAPETEGAKGCTVYGSTWQVAPGGLTWASLASVPTAGESAAYVGETLLGIFRRDLSKPTKGSAWLVARDSPWDPRGMFLIVR